MDDKAFFETVIPEPWTILGLRLRPFSLGHVFILSRIGSPFFSDESTAVTPDDIIKAVFFCSLTYQECLEALDDPNFAQRIEDWAGEATGANHWLCRLGLRKSAEVNWGEKARMLSEYIAEGSKSPDYTYSDDRTKSVDCPMAQIIKITLMMELGIDDDKIMDRPWGQCLTDFVTIRAVNGDVDFVDIGDIEDAKKAANEIQRKIDEKGLEAWLQRH